MKKVTNDWIDFNERHPKVGSLIAILVRNELKDKNGNVFYEDIHNAQYATFYKREFAIPNCKTLDNDSTLTKTIAYWYPLPPLPKNSVKVYRSLDPEDIIETKPKVKIQ